MSDIEEWEQKRVGKITASRMKDVLAKGKGITRAKYCAELVAARMSGKPHRNTFSSPEMEHGNLYEAEARAQYVLRNVVLVEQDGKIFTDHPFVQNSGASFDGLVGDDGMVQIKCPSTHVFIGYKMDVVVPTDYIPQMTWELAVSRRKWADFVAYDPDLPEEDGYFQVRFEPTQKDIADLEREVRAFDAEVNLLVEKIIAMRGKQ